MSGIAFRFRKSLTSTSVIGTVSKVVEEAGGDVEPLKNAQVNKIEGETVIKETDVVVIGGGGGSKRNS